MKSRVVVAVGALALLILAFGVTPLALRRVSFFDIREVEIVGARYHAPTQLVKALELEPNHNLFASKSDLRQRLAALPGVHDVKIVRRLPATLRVVVTERLPVAFVSDSSGLVALDDEAHPLPYDPTVSGVDLPLIPHPDMALVQTLTVVRVTDAALFQEIHSARHGAGDAIILELGMKQIILRGVPTAADVRAIGAVRRELANLGRQYEELDARFSGRVFVRRSGA